MTIFKRPNTHILWCKFKYRGKEYRRSTGTSSKREAAAFERKWRSEIENAPEEPEKPALTPTIAILRDMDINRATAEGRTKTYIDKGLRIYWKNLGIFFQDTRYITADSLLDYVKYRQLQGVRGQTIKKELVLLKRGLQMALEREFDIMIPKRWPKIQTSPKKEPQAGKFYGQETTLKFLAALKPQVRKIAIVAIATGMRSAELRRLEARWIKPAAQTDIIPAYLHLPAEATKTRRERLIGLAPTIYKLLYARALECPEGPLFPSDNKKAFLVASQKAGEKSITLRDLRHTFATVADMSGDSRGTDLVMGHAGGIPSRYQHTYIERIGKIALTLETWLLGKGGTVGVNFD